MDRSELVHIIRSELVRQRVYLYHDFEETETVGIDGCLNYGELADKILLDKSDEPVVE